MEGLPSGDIQAKYQKLASEYSKLRVHVKVLKKGVLDEQAKSNELLETIKEKDKLFRKSELEIDSLTFRNQQLTRRVSVLQDELEFLQTKQSKKNKGKTDEKPTSSKYAPLDPGLLQEELQKKIIESATFASQLSDKIFEISQLKATLEDFQKHISETDNKYKNEMAKLRSKNQELQLALEEAQKERPSVTPSRGNVATSSQGASYNGDFISEAGSLLGSEDALSSVDELNLNEQISLKAHNLEEECENLKMENGILKLENETLKLEISKHVSASQKKRSDGHDSGDFNAFGQTSVDAEGRVVGLLGSLKAPFILSEEVLAREDRIKIYYRNQISQLSEEMDEVKSKTEHYVKECEMLRNRFEIMEQVKEMDERALRDKHDTICRLEEELHSTTRNYEEQMCVLTEHVAGLTETIARQHDQIDSLKQQLKRKK